MKHNIPSYFPLEVEEIVKESDTAFLFRCCDGEQLWIRKTEIVSFNNYSLGDRNITIHISGGNCVT